MAMYVYEIGKISAEPQGAAEMVPRGWTLFGSGIPTAGTCKGKEKHYCDRLMNVSYRIAIQKLGTHFLGLSMRILKQVVHVRCTKIPGWIIIFSRSIYSTCLTVV